MRLRRCHLNLLFFLALAWAAAAPPTRAQQMDSTLVARFRLAESYLRGGQFDRAILMLEDLYAARPSTFVFYDKLREAYESVKRYDEAVALVERQMDRGATNPVFMSEKARLLYLKGDEPAAFQAWEDALALAPDQRGTYRTVYQSMYGVRQIDRAIEVLERGRKHLGEEGNFEADLAGLYSLAGRHGDAMRAYVRLLGESPDRASYVRSRLGRYLEQDDAALASLEVVEAAVQAAPLDRPLRELLAWLYLETGDFRRAFDTNRAIDRLEGEDGRVLFGFAGQAAAAGAYDVARDAYDEILTRYPDAPAAADALFGVAVMHEEWGRHTRERAFDDAGNRVPAEHYDQALATYRRFLQEHPHHPRQADVLRRIGTLQREVFFDLGAAEASLREVIRETGGQSSLADWAEYDLGQIALLQGRLDDARVTFNRLMERLRTGELAERARYELTLLHFYQGEFDAAQTLAEVLNENTSTDVANDAIELKVLLLENRGPDSLDTPLAAFARARLLERQRQPRAALATLDSLLARFGAHPLADDVRFRRAGVLRDLGRFDEALAAYQELPLLHPGTYLADRSLFAAGEVLEYDFGQPEAAIEAYTRLLTDYPGSLLVPDARLRIRRLRGDVM